VARPTHQQHDNLISRLVSAALVPHRRYASEVRSRWGCGEWRRVAAHVPHDHTECFANVSTGASHKLTEKHNTNTQTHTHTHTGKHTQTQTHRHSHTHTCTVHRWCGRAAPDYASKFVVRTAIMDRVLGRSSLHSNVVRLQAMLHMCVHALAYQTHTHMRTVFASTHDN
jgi:hypothetical protein